MAGERRVDRDLGGLEVANFADHHDVRRLPEHGAEGGGERHPDVVPHRHLVDAVELVFHRVLDRDDLAVGLVDEMEAAVERRRLARAGRAKRYFFSWGEPAISIGASHS